MNATHFIKLASIAAIGWHLLAAPVLAQSTPGAVAAAREVVELKGGTASRPRSPWCRPIRSSRAISTP